MSEGKQTVDQTEIVAEIKRHLEVSLALAIQLTDAQAPEGPLFFAYNELAILIRDAKDECP